MNQGRVFINGDEVRDIDCSDRGFQYGDGVFETIAVHQHIPLFLKQHLDRLYLGCSALSIPFSDSSELRDEINYLVQSQAFGVLKIQITRGAGGRGYRTSAQASPSRVISLHPMPDYPKQLTEIGIKACYCQTRLAINPKLAIIKHMNRLEQILARQEWDSADIHEGLMRDSEGFVVEGTMSNLFWVQQGQLYTPKIDRCGVAGIMRSIVLEQALEQGEGVRIKRCTQEDIKAAEELFITNSVMGLWPIRQLNDLVYPVGAVSHTVKKWLDKRIQQELS